MLRESLPLRVQRVIVYSGEGPRESVYEGFSFLDKDTFGRELSPPNPKVRLRQRGRKGPILKRTLRVLGGILDKMNYSVDTKATSSVLRGRC
jgi:hypothetical protein